MFQIELVKKAMGGDSEAQLELAQMYVTGRSVPQDYEKAVYWFGEHSNSDHGIWPNPSFRKIVELAEFGEPSALKWLVNKVESEKSVLVKSACAKFVGLVYERRNERNNALRWYMEGYKIGGESLSDVYLLAIDGCSQALHELEILADNGDAEAQLQIGDYYCRHSLSTKERKLEKALFFYSEVFSNLKSAPQMKKKAVQKIGDLATLDCHDPSIDWLEKNAESLDDELQYVLGMNYQRGELRVTRFIIAFISKLTGWGLAAFPQDREKACRWLAMAATNGNEYAQYQVGMHFLKYGSAQQMVEAYKWLILSAAQKNHNAVTELDKLERLLNKDQILEAQKGAREFLERDNTSIQSI